MTSSSSNILSLKILLITFSIVSVAMSVKLAVPLILNFAVTDIPVIWSVITSWLKPPYLYVILNIIIVTIAASTRFQHTTNNNINPTNDVSRSHVMSDILPEAVYHVEKDVIVEPPVVFESKHVVDDDVKMVSVDEEAGATWHPTPPLVDARLPRMKVQQPEFGFPVVGKQLAASRFAHNRMPLKTSAEGGRALRVLKSKKHETMESTWKMITEGRSMPLTRHLQKSDTFQNRNVERHFNDSTSTTKIKVVKKSETFKDRTNYENENQYLSPSSSTNLSPATSGKLKKDGSLSHDELNRRVEAFIKKFNDDMRLQRQESLNHYMDLVNRGAH